MAERLQDDDLEIAERNFNRMCAERSKEGFREGLAAAQEKELQAGFEMGYEQAVVTSLRWGQLLGEISCLKVYAERSGREELAKRLTELQREADRAKHFCVDADLKRHLQQIGDTKEQDAEKTHLCSGHQQSITVAQLIQEQGSSETQELGDLRRQMDELRCQLIQPSTDQQ